MARKSSGIITEPKPDWVPPWKAPFYCFAGRYIRSAQEWVDALYAELKDITESDQWAETLEMQEITEMEHRFGLDGEWVFMPATEEPGAWITALGIRTRITPGFVCVMPTDADSIIKFDRWLIAGSSNEMLSDENWNDGLRASDKDTFCQRAGTDEDGLLVYEIPRDQKTAAQWHKELLSRLFWSWERNFSQVIESGASHIMARKGSVLAPFERITWNQWQYFRLERLAPSPQKGNWGDPKLRYWERHALPWTAVGPADEKLYEIHIAPGVNRPKSDDRNRSPEENCLGWLMELIRHYPDRPPKRRDLLGREAISKFPGLTQNGFLRCFALVQAQTQNRNWSQPGRFPKSPQNSLQKI